MKNEGKRMKNKINIKSVKSMIHKPSFIKYLMLKLI